jgi:hypothetical protein
MTFLSRYPKFANIARAESAPVEQMAAEGAALE